MQVTIVINRPHMNGVIYLLYIIVYYDVRGQKV